MIELKKCQENAVNKLLLEYCKYRNTSKKEIYFQAPTGSGKTLILCDLCKRIFEVNKKENRKCIILFISISTGDIHEQNYDKARYYKNLNNYQYECKLIHSPSDDETSKTSKDYMPTIKLPTNQDNCVYFMGTATYKEKGILYERQIFNSFIENAKKQGYEIIYIRDEAHIGTKKDKYPKKLNDLLTEVSSCTFYVSATLEQTHKVDVQITYEEAIEDGLIKGNQILFEGLKYKDEVTDDDLLEYTIKEFKKIKQEYSKLSYHINPCLLIQIKNSKIEDKKEEKEYLDKLVKTINDNNLKYVLHIHNATKNSLSDNGLGNSKIKRKKDKVEISNAWYFKDKSCLTDKDKKLITANDSDIDVVIFKVALATGWDIPRANMLLQLRQIYSDTLDIQTIGRIRRNPLARKLDLDSPEKILNNYYIYSNLPKINTSECQALKYNDSLQIMQWFQTVLINKTNLLTNNSNASKQKLLDFYDKLIDNFNKKTIFNKDGVDSKKTYYQIIQDINQQINSINNYQIELNLLYLDDKQTESIPLVSEEITNVFAVDKCWNEKIKSYNDEYFTYVINDFVNYYSKQNKLNKYAIKLFFCNNKYKEAFTHFCTEFNLLNQDNEFDYKLSDKFTLPNKTLEFLNNTKKSNRLELKQSLMNYLYWVPDEENNESQSDKKIDNSVYNDSHGEKEFIDRMLLLFDEKFKNNKPHVYLVKNYLNNSNFRYEYIDEQPLKMKRSHYPDFIIEKDNEIYVCELKSLTNDYDSLKTKELGDAYKVYSSKSKYHYILIKWDESSYSFTWVHYFNGEILNKFDKEKDLSKIFA